MFWLTPAAALVNQLSGFSHMEGIYFEAHGWRITPPRDCVSINDLFLRDFLSLATFLLLVRLLEAAETLPDW